MFKRNITLSILSVFLFTFALSINAGAEVSGDELAMFVKAADKVQEIEDKAEVDMVSAINGQGLNMDRYIELVNMENVKDAVSQEEYDKYTTAKNKIDGIKTEMEQKQLEAIKSAGLDVNRYREIAEAASEDPELAQKINGMMQN